MRFARLAPTIPGVGGVPAWDALRRFIPEEDGAA
jgi:hypothetical protein